MSKSVSQIEFWLEGDEPNTNNNANGGDGAIYLSYDVFLGLSVFGGFLGLDHLYLRSPLTFLAKIIVNVMFFGIWWIYDATQAVFNKDVVKVFGLGIPGLGPKGIGAGVLAKDEPDRKHMRFFIYAFCLLFGGIVGIDSFVLGHSNWGLFSLIATLSVIFLPASAANWGYQVFRFFTDVKSVINENSSYFGGPPGQSASGRFFSKILSYFIKPIEIVAKPVADAIVTASSALDKASTAVTGVTDTAKMAIEKGSDIVKDVSKVVHEVSTIGTVAPGVSLYSAITPQAVKETKEKLAPQGLKESAAAGLKGGALLLGAGSSLNALPYFLLGTLTFIVVAGFAITYYRSKKDEPNDSPPEPRVFRGTDQKGRPTRSRGSH